MKGKIIVSVMMIVTMLIIAVLGSANQQNTLEIYSPANESGHIDVLDKSTVQSVSVSSNNTQNAVVLFNYQYINSYSLQAFAWNYYYVDLAPNTYLSLTHTSQNSLEIYLEYYTKPTTYAYSKKAIMTYRGTELTSDAKTYSNRVYIGVRNPYSYASTGYTLSVRINTKPITPTPTTPTTSVVYRTNNGLSLALGIPSMVMFVVLFFVVLSLIKKIKVLTNRVEQLEKKLQDNMQPEEMQPVMMNVPLMSANSLQQDHEEIQQTIQPPTSTPQVPEQQPTTIPQMFPQFVQQQSLPPQFRNAQPYPFMYHPQVVYAQPPQIQQPTVVPQQQTTAQAKQ